MKSVTPVQLNETAQPSLWCAWRKASKVHCRAEHTTAGIPTPVNFRHTRRPHPANRRQDPSVQRWTVFNAIFISRLPFEERKKGLWYYYAVYPSVGPPLIAFEPTGRFSRYSSESSCHWRWSRRHIFNFIALNILKGGPSDFWDWYNTFISQYGSTKG
jgi:hypothetical protein